MTILKILKEKRTIFIFAGLLAVIVIVFLSLPLFLKKQKSDIKKSSGVLAPLQESPPDKEVVFNIGPLEVKTYNPVTFTIENSTNLYFDLKNTGANDIKVNVFDPSKPIKDSSPNKLAFQHFFGFQESEIALKSGEAKTIEYMITAPEKSSEGGVGFPFEVSTGDKKTITIDIVSKLYGRKQNNLPKTATIKGKITGKNGDKVKKANIKAVLFNSTEPYRAELESDGTYSISLPSIEDIKAILGKRRVPYKDLYAAILVEAEEYKFYYKGNLDLKRGEELDLDIELEKLDKAVSYEEIGSYTSDGVYGYWWLLPNQDFSWITAVQGRHPPELKKPGHVVSLDLSGKERWKVETSDECWGFDISKDGKIAAGCSDGTLYVISVGKVLWKTEKAGQNRNATFSPDGKYVFSGPNQSNPQQKTDALLYDAANGNIVWRYKFNDKWLRASRWSKDGEKLVAGFSGGKTVLLDKNGGVLWERNIGEFPMVTEIDNDYNVYLAGKNRELFSFDKEGNLRFRYRIGNHVVTAGSNNMAKERDLLVFGTVGGWMYAFNRDGELVWQQDLPPILQGHNALDITPSGDYIAVGTAGDEGGSVSVYDKNGTALWSKEFKDSRGKDWPYEFDHNHIGAITIAISDDGKYVAAGFGDSNIKIFERK